MYLQQKAPSALLSVVCFLATFFLPFTSNLCSVVYITARAPFIPLSSPTPERPSLSPPFLTEHPSPHPLLDLQERNHLVRHPRRPTNIHHRRLPRVPRPQRLSQVVLGKAAAIADSHARTDVWVRSSTGRGQSREVGRNGLRRARGWSPGSNMQIEPMAPFCLRACFRRRRRRRARRVPGSEDPAQTRKEEDALQRLLAGRRQARGVEQADGFWQRRLLRGERQVGEYGE